jgi:hypothetical protein
MAATLLRCAQGLDLDPVSVAGKGDIGRLWDEEVGQQPTEPTGVVAVSSSGVRTDTT